MNNIELSAVRRLLFYSVADAAREIGCCSERAWNHWEKGARKIPDDVARKMREMMDYRAAIIDEYFGIEELLVFTQADFVMSHEPPEFYWPYHSAIAELYSYGKGNKTIKLFRR